MSSLESKHLQQKRRLKQSLLDITRLAHICVSRCQNNKYVRVCRSSAATKQARRRKSPLLKSNEPDCCDWLVWVVCLQGNSSPPIFNACYRCKSCTFRMTAADFCVQHVPHSLEHTHTNHSTKRILNLRHSSSRGCSPNHQQLGKF